MEPDAFGFPRGAKFRVFDLRADHEKEIKDLAETITVTDEAGQTQSIEIPRVNLEYLKLTTNMYDEEYLTRNIWFVLLCQHGLVSGQAHNHLKRKGYFSKILLGGVDALPQDLIKE